MKIKPYLQCMEPTLDKRSPDAQDEEARKLLLKLKDRSIYITKRFVIGRGGENEIPLPRDSLVSRRHARIEFVQGVYYLHDLQSTNGTYLNNEPLHKGEKKVIAVGDSITIGNTVITVAAENPSPRTYHEYPTF